MRNLILLMLLLLVACDSQGTDKESVLDSVGSIDEAASSVSSLAPDFSLEALDGETFTLSGLRGKWVLVNFWATWCVPCRAEMPAFQAIYERYGDQLEILAINHSESAEAVAAYRDEMNLSFPLLLNPSDQTLADYKVLGLPITIIVDPDGLLVWQYFGEVDLGEFETTIADLIEARP
jgi:thiol-disulfide isomerase/thioredoxin